MVVRTSHKENRKVMLDRSAVETATGAETHEQDGLKRATDDSTAAPVGRGRVVGSNVLGSTRSSGILVNRLISVASIVVVLSAWQVFASTGLINQNLASSPWGVVQAFRFLIDKGILGGAIASSAELFGVGLGLAILIGAIGGVAIGWWRIVGSIFEPWIAILYSMPIIALLPLILVWFGIAFRSEVIMVVLISVFPVLVGVIAGTRNVDPTLIRLARSFCGRELAVVRTIVVPSLVPYFIAGVRIAIGGALVGVVVSEYFLGNSGIGGLIVTAGENLQSGQVFVGVTILAVSAVLMTTILRRIERYIVRWQVK